MKIVIMLLIILAIIIVTILRRKHWGGRGNPQDLLTFLVQLSGIIAIILIEILF